ncbi:hypothetical protein FNO01nite_05140 [Flavobacterium noncentrifugens]|uniref:Uncharacterized membrane protein YphA, DoxX/SURF4 family n=1 Tax=Flavobacterium noncentrifugens TaxID=1128970 RepID=A0A1G8SJX7_9FLAO|nr:MauE/DoxX family redox-associated membrane protein [Flavobacterium noncentrifugens]GEP49842.1 hypothetical protein FNO01nite_05140 [Flavobacterium noncentrifugens]SDJ28920.1 Uncharacterized membrane protein YphA, DoxX/SURF4 family [Flavobacterium noncentrifugens]
MDAPATKRVIIQIVTLLYILLFIYAATAKLLDLENFTVQLGQSPLLSAFASWVGYAVIAAEFLIAALLIFPKTRLAGLFAAFGLMVMFTAYIYIILNYSEFVPCSCGGILEKLGWKEHLVFNIIFVILAASAVLLHCPGADVKTALNSKGLAAVLILLSILSCCLVVALFISSEKIIHYSNTLTRRFPHWPAVKKNETDLKLNSYYLAGVSKDKIYLGNSTAPLVMTVLDTSLKQKEVFRIGLDKTNYPFKALKTAVEEPYFFIADGTVPVIFRGNINDWKAKMLLQGGFFFSQAVPVDSTTLIMRNHKPKTGEMVIGKVSLARHGAAVQNPSLLQKQIDGIFDTDGYLKYSSGLHSLVYLYAYRNGFTVADTTLNLIKRGNTIDTFGHAKLQIVNVASHAQRKMAAPPVIVNRQCAVSGNLLFVNSGIMGRYDSEEMWEKHASIIDLYNLSDGSYLFSFYIYNVKGARLKEFAVSGNMLYALIGDYVVSYKLGSTITDAYQQSGKIQNQ